MGFLNLLKIENLKIYAIVLAIVYGVWFYKEYTYQKQENKRQSENISQIRMMDSLRFASQTYTKKELEQYLEYTRKDLKGFLKKNRVSEKRIERIITQKLDYLDLQRQTTDLQPVLEAIKKNRDTVIAVKDSTKCLVVEGWVRFKNDSLKLDSRK